METSIELLLLVDRSEDAESIIATLEEAGIEARWTGAQTEDAFLGGLEGDPDIIVAYEAPGQFDAARALEIVGDRRQHVPLIVLAEDADEETVAARMGAGAYDYLTRERLGHLGEAVRRALSEREQLEETGGSEVLLHEREAHYRALVEQSLMGIYVVVGGKFAYINRAAADIFGYRPAEIIGRLGPMDLTYPEDRHKVAEQIQRRLDGEIDSVRYRFRGVTKDGDILDLEVHGRRVSYKGQAAILGALAEVSDEVRSRRELDLLLTVNEAVSSAGDLDAGLALALKKVCEATGWSYGEAWLPEGGDFLVAGPSWHDGSQKMEAFASASRPLRFLKGQGLPGHVWADKSPLWIQDVTQEKEIEFQRAELAGQAGLKAAYGVPILSEGLVQAVFLFLLKVPQAEQGHLMELVSTVAAQIGTIVRRKQVEMALRESEARFRRLSENAQDVIMRIDLSPTPEFVYVSPAAEDILGYAPEDFYRDSELMLRLTHHEDRPSLTATFETRSLPTDRLELRLRNRAGDLVWMELTIVPVEKEGNLVAVEVIGRDISKRKLDETRIRSQVERLDALRRIDTAISGSMDLRVTFNVLLEQVTGRLGVDAAVILIYESGSQRLTYGASRGFQTNALRHTNLRLGSGLAGKAALERELVYVPELWETEEEILAMPGMREEGFVSYVGVPLVARGQVRGVLEVFHRSVIPLEDSWREFLEALAGQAAIAIDNASLFDELQRFNAELTRAYDATIEGWARALELRDRETQGHTNRVTSVTLRLASSVGLPQRELIHVQRGALLHDIGKMGIPDDILLKPAKLTEAEWDEMRRHPIYAYQMLSPVAYLRPALDIPYCHHERWDGSGYPRGLQEKEIPLQARIFSVVDVWDALRSERPYRGAWPDDRVVEYIREQAGQHFDPAIAEQFLELEPELREFVRTLDRHLTY